MEVLKCIEYIKVMLFMAAGGGEKGLGFGSMENWMFGFFVGLSGFKF